MKVADSAPYWFICLSIFIALVLEVLPLSGVALLVRPEFVFMVVIYWAIYSPLRIGLGVAFFLGLLLDIIHGAWLGVHSILLIFIVVFLYVFAKRIRMFGKGKQVVLVFSLVLIANIISFLLQFPKWTDLTLVEIFMPALISGFFWPIAVLMMSRVRYGSEFDYL